MAVSAPGCPRKRKKYTRSLLGCGNCRLRRVKCDEHKPQCLNCVKYGVTCDYEDKSGELHSLSELVTQHQDASDGVSIRSPCSLNDTMLGMINGALECSQLGQSQRERYFLTFNDLERLHRFQNCTVLSMGGPKTARIYQSEVIKLMFLHPYLLHAVMTLTAKHDRLSLPSPSEKQVAFESYHWAQAASLLNQKLSGPINRTDRDALWITAAYLTRASFCATECTSVEECWPLRDPSATDFDWVDMQKGLKTMWAISDVSRPESAFRGIVLDSDEDCITLAPVASGIEGVPPFLVRLCGLDEHSNPENNPYHEAVRRLSPLLDIECTYSTMLRFFTFTNTMVPEFKALLQQRDPRALLLLAYWYAKVFRSVWWVKSRALLECKAICIYLDRYHHDDKCIQDLMWFPKIECGYNVSYKSCPFRVSPFSAPLAEDMHPTFAEIRTR